MFQGNVNEMHSFVDDSLRVNVWLLRFFIKVLFIDLDDVSEAFL